MALSKEEKKQLLDAGAIYLRVEPRDAATLIAKAPARVAKSLVEQVRRFLSPLRKKYVAAADKQYGKDGEIEIDHNAVWSPGEDHGAYVQAWVWVYACAAGIAQADSDEPDDCREVAMELLQQQVEAWHKGGGDIVIPAHDHKFVDGLEMLLAELREARLNAT